MSDMNQERIDRLRQYYDTHSVEDEIANAVRDDTPLSPMSGYSIRLPTHLLNRARDLAAAQGTTTGAWLREAIETAVAKQDSTDAATPPPAETAEIARIKAMVLKEFEATLKDRVDAYVDLRIGRPPSPFGVPNAIPPLLNQGRWPARIQQTIEELEKTTKELQKEGRADRARLLSAAAGFLSRLTDRRDANRPATDFPTTSPGLLSAIQDFQSLWWPSSPAVMDETPLIAVLTSLDDRERSTILSDPDGRSVQVKWSESGEITSITPVTESEPSASSEP